MCDQRVIQNSEETERQKEVYEVFLFCVCFHVCVLIKGVRPTRARGKRKKKKEGKIAS